MTTLKAPGSHRSVPEAELPCSRRQAGFSPQRHAKRSRRGAAAVEFAFIAPIIFLLLFATIEFGRVIMVIHGLETAAREGCREAVAWDPSGEKIQQTVADRLKPFGISGYTLTLDPAVPQNANQWDPVTVQIKVLYDQVSWLPLPRFLEGITLSGSCTLPQESNHDD